MQLAVVDDEAGHRSLGVLDAEEDRAVGVPQHTPVTDLSATLGVEGRLVEHDAGCGRGVGVPLGIGPRFQLLVLGGVAHDGADAAAGGRGLVPAEGAVAESSRDAVEERRLLGLAGEVELLARPAALTLLLQRDLEAVAVDAHAVLRRQLDGQVDGEAVGVVQPEGGVAVEHGRVHGHVFGSPAHHPVRGGERDERFLELDGAGIERAREGGLLADDGAHDDVAALAQDGVGIAHELDDDPGGLLEERLVTSQEAAVSHGPADDAAQHVASPLVGGQDAVGDEEGDGPRVVGDDLVAEALALEGVGVMPQQLPQSLMDGHEQVGVVVAGDILQHRGEALETHAGVDRFEGQLRAGSLDRLVELHEHEVPDLQPARAGLGVVGHAARPLGEVLAAVVVDLAVGTARARVGHAPEVVVVPVVDIAPARHALGRQADLVAPDGPRLLVVGVGGGGQAVAGDAQVLGQELPGPVDGLALEVVAEGPAAEHLEERVVAWGATDLLEVVVLAGYAQAAL